MKINIIILAAGKGTRLEKLAEGKPKAMVLLNNKPFIEYAVKLAEKLKVKPIVVVGYKKDQIIKYLKNRAKYVIQYQQFGTGHAVKSASKLLKGKKGITLVYFADMPLWSLKTARKIIHTFRKARPKITITSAKIPDSFNYGRTIRDKFGKVIKIVETKDCSKQELKVREMHASFYAFDNFWLFNNIGKLKKLNKQGEYYLTDTVGLAISQGEAVEGIICDKSQEALGINTSEDLKKVTALLSSRT